MYFSFNLIESIGWIGAACFAFSAAPQAWKAIKQGHSRGIAHAMLWMWLVGEVCTLLYIYITVGPKPVLMANYGLNLMFLFPIFYYRYFPR